MGVERPIGNESNGLGSDAAPPVCSAKPVADFGTSPIDVGHRLKPHAADGTTVNEDRKVEGGIDRRNASDVFLGIDKMIRMGKQVAELNPNATVVRRRSDRRRISGDKLSDNAPPSNKLNAHTHSERTLPLRHLGAAAEPSFTLGADPSEYRRVVAEPYSLEGSRRASRSESSGACR